MTTTSTLHTSRILITGAAGGLGKILRETLRPYADKIRLSDLAPIEGIEGDQYEIQTANLADKQSLYHLVQDVDAIVHLGGISVERPFEEILEANIKGTYNLYEAARKQGVKRIIFASSNHVIGFYPQSEHLDSRVPKKPDGYYGLSKSFGEDLASFYYDRYGIETVSLRIGSSFPEPRDRRMLSTWLSYADLTDLVVKALFTPNVGHTIVYGVSNNRDLWWDNSQAQHLGWTPKDSSEPFRESIEQQPPLDPKDPSAIYQGGAFTAKGPF